MRREKKERVHNAERTKCTIVKKANYVKWQTEEGHPFMFGIYYTTQ